MIGLAPQRIAEVAGARVLAPGPEGRPSRAVIDSRAAADGDLFFGLPGTRADGGAFAERAAAAGAWGVVATPAHAEALASSLEPGASWVLASEDPLRSLQLLAREWRRELGCPTVGITGSVGKTTVKDLARTLIGGRVHASAENFNTEIGLPLSILEAPAETEYLVLEMAMRGPGQIAELCEIAEPDVAAITNIGPVHLELLGSIEAIASAKAEILAGLGPTGRAVVPAAAEALAPHLHERLVTLAFGPGGEVFALESEIGPDSMRALVGTPHGEAEFRFPFGGEHNLLNALCAIAIGVSLDVGVEQMARRASDVAFSRLRGELIYLPREIVVLNDCYNANPVSMRAALDQLATLRPAASRVAVLGGMAELGPDAERFHREITAHARDRGLRELHGVGELARAYGADRHTDEPVAAAERLAAELEPGDAVLVKGSRSVGLERFTERLRELIGEQPPEGS